MAKDAYYFSHDSNAHTDPKIVRLLRDHDWYGYGLYWALVELLRNEATYKLETDYETHAFALRTDSKRIKSVVEDYKLFTVESGSFWSESLLRRMKKREEVSKKRSESAQSRWKDTKAMQMHSKPDALKERKGKERKELHTSEYSDKFESFWSEYPNKTGKAKAYSSWKKFSCENGKYDKIMKALSQQKKSDQWAKNSGQFIPNGSTWVNQKRWEDYTEESQGGRQWM